jgi:hypothetical protein
MKISAFLKDSNSSGTLKSVPASACRNSQHAEAPQTPFPRCGTRKSADASACHRSANLTLRAKPRSGIPEIVPADMNKNIVVKISCLKKPQENAFAMCKNVLPASTSISTLAAASALLMSAHPRCTSTRRHANASVNHRLAKRAMCLARKSVPVSAPQSNALRVITGTALSAVASVFQNRVSTVRSGIQILALASAALSCAAPPPTGIRNHASANALLLNVVWISTLTQKRALASASQLTARKENSSTRSSASAFAMLKTAVKSSAFQMAQWAQD